MATDLERLATGYDEAEAAFLHAVAEGADRAMLSQLADATAGAASALQGAANRALFSGESAWVPLEELTEATEQLAGLWRDLASAYAGRPFASENPFLGRPAQP